MNRVVAADDLADATGELAHRLAQGPPLAYGAAKAAVHASANLPFESLLDSEARNQRVVGRSDDVKEGIQFFLEKRNPNSAAARPAMQGGPDGQLRRTAVRLRQSLLRG